MSKSVKFKKGDRVVLLSGTKLGTVVGFDFDYDPEVLWDEGGYTFTYYTDKLRLATHLEIALA